MPRGLAATHGPTTLVLDAGCVGFALWTLAANLCAFAGLSLYAALVLAGAASVACLAVAWRRTRGFGTRLKERLVSLLTRSCEPESRLVAEEACPPVRLWFSCAAALSGVLLALAYRETGSVMLLWLLAVALLLAGVLTETFPSYRLEPVGARFSAEAFLWALGVVVAAITLVAHRPSSDDTFYINIAVAAADSPGAPLLAGDTMIGVPGLELNLPIYKVHAIEALTGVLALLLRVRALDVAYFVVPTAAALLTPLALGRLFRTLLPGSRALWATGFALLFLLVEGSAYAGFANHAFVRLHHGKGIFLTLAVPTLIVYALRFGAEPTRARFAMLLAAEVASVGLTSTAMWIAPLVLACSLACVFRPDRTRIRAFALGLFASAYPVGLGLSLRGQLADVLPSMASDVEVAPVPTGVPVEAEHLIADALSIGLDGIDVQAMTLLVILSGWAFYRPGTAARRFLLTYVLMFFLFGWNPLLAPFEKAVVSPLFERIVWVLPVPALVALGFSSLMVERAPRLVHYGTRIVALSLVVVFLTFVPNTYALSRANFVTLKRPAHKAAREFEIAHLLNELTPGRGFVLAPQGISVWMTTEQLHAYPLATKPKYLRKQPSMPREEAALREALMRFAEGMNDHGKPASKGYIQRFEPTLAAALERFRIATACFPHDARTAGAFRRALRAAGFSRAMVHDDWEIWTRPPKPAG